MDDLTQYLTEKSEANQRVINAKWKIIRDQLSTYKEITSDMSAEKVDETLQSLKNKNLISEESLKVINADICKLDRVNRLT